jgi:three-Cys-motif partner protein
MAPKPPPSDDQSPQYWAEYTNLQHVKHALIRKYLGGWFAKLGHWAGRVLYIDTHAGRGTHLTGDLGSPLVALHTLLDHSSLGTLLATSEFRFTFIERDEKNCAVSLIRSGGRFNYAA